MLLFSVSFTMMNYRSCSNKISFLWLQYSITWNVFNFPPKYFFRSINIYVPNKVLSTFIDKTNHLFLYINIWFMWRGGINLISFSTQINCVFGDSYLLWRILLISVTYLRERISLLLMKTALNIGFCTFIYFFFLSFIRSYM